MLLPIRCFGELHVMRRWGAILLVSLVSGILGAAIFDFVDTKYLYHTRYYHRGSVTITQLILRPEQYRGTEVVISGAINVDPDGTIAPAIFLTSEQMRNGDYANAIAFDPSTISPAMWARLENRNGEFVAVRGVFDETDRIGNLTDVWVFGERGLRTPSEDQPTDPE